jgi:hypothetical protein
MAKGDQADFVARLLRLLPGGWFPSVAPRLWAALQGWAVGLASVFTMQAFARAQMRVSTATGSFLDLCALDFFGVDGLPRLQLEADADYRARIIFNLSAPRGTWPGMVRMITQLTGYPPIIIQPNNPATCGGLATPANPAAGGGLLALDGPGCIGSLTTPGQVFITVQRPTSGYGIFGGLNGLATPANPAIGGGYGLATPGNPSAGGGLLCLADAGSLPGYITDAFIYEQVNNWMPAGFVAWTRIT